MSAILDRNTLEQFRRLTPHKAYLAAKDAVYRSGAVSSEDFLDIYEQLVDEGILSWDQIEEYRD